MGITVKLNQAEIYQATYRGLYKSLPKWKQELVDQNDERATESLAKEVIKYAERKKDQNSHDRRDESAYNALF